MRAIFVSVVFFFFQLKVEKDFLTNQPHLGKEYLMIIILAKLCELKWKRIERKEKRIDSWWWVEWKDSEMLHGQQQPLMVNVWYYTNMYE